MLNKKLEGVVFVYQYSIVAQANDYLNRHFCLFLIT